MPSKKLQAKQIKKFQKEILQYYQKNKRDLPWRPPSLKFRRDKALDPYKILISEVMLQQTQVERVKYYYAAFLKEFPTWKTLANAPTKQLLSLWQGMGYNRRALYLQRTAKIIIEKYSGKLPQNEKELITLPGIGKATAAAILTYAYNFPVIFIETNIRRVFIYWFFKNQKAVHDKEILSLVEQTLPKKPPSAGRSPREWYWALMDYGSMLAKTETNPNHKSKHYTKQSKFEGSQRQLRGTILKTLLDSSLTLEQLTKQTKRKKPELTKILSQLAAEGFIKKNGDFYRIS